MADRAMMRKYLDLVTAGQFEEAERYYADDITVHIRGHNPASGDYSSVAEYNAALSQMMGTLDALTVEEHDLLVSDDHAVVLSTWHVTRGGETTLLNHVIVYHTDGDEITELWIIPEDSEKDATTLS